MKEKRNFRDKIAKDAKRQQEAKSTYGYLKLPKDVSVFSPEPGSRVKLDFLPYPVKDPKHPDRDEENEIAIPGTLWYKRPFKIHRNIGVENETYVCRTSIGERCPICEYRAKLIKEGAGKDETNPLKPSQRNLYIVIPLDSKKFEEKIHIMDVSQFLFQSLLNEELNDSPENGIFPDLKEGLTLRVRFDSNTLPGSQPFAEASRIDFLERDSTYDEEILDKVPNLDEVLNILSYEKLESKFFEMGDVPTKEEEEEEEPAITDKKEESTLLRKPKTISPSETKEVKVKKNEVVEEEEEEEEEEEKKVVKDIKKNDAVKTKSTVTRGATQTTKSNNSGCPHGHQFGKDFERFDECAECEKWDDCYDARE